MAKRECQEECPQLSIRTQFGLYLAFLRIHSPLYTRLSLNITREVFSYIGLDHFYLCTIKCSQLVVYDLATESIQARVPYIYLSLAGTGLAMLTKDTMLVVGGTSGERNAKSLNIWTGTIINEADMMEGRSCPGMLVYKGCAWVFGGTGLASVERFHYSMRNWERGPQMPTPKSSFTPCAYQGLIYLPYPSPDRKQLEVLNPITEAYSLRPLELYSPYYGSVSFAVNNTLYVFDYAMKAGTWALGSQDTQLTNLQVVGKQKGYTNCSPIKCGNAIYWLNLDFSLVKFDLKTLILTTTR